MKKILIVLIVFAAITAGIFIYKKANEPSGIAIDNTPEEEYLSEDYYDNDTSFEDKELPVMEVNPDDLED